MMPAAKHGDPQLGVDIHLCVVPPAPSPVPLPTPHMSIVFDPMDYIPFFGATVTVCGMKRATAGTNGTVVHIPPGFPFAPKLPDKDDELFMGSATVVADGDPFSFIGVPVLGCQVAGLISPFRIKKKGGKKSMLLPTTFNLAIPSTVFIGGPPTISLMGMASKLGFAALGKFAKSKFFKRIRQKLFGHMKPGFLKCKILRAEPVNILSGEVVLEQEDFSLPGRIPIEWLRSYDSGNRRKGACGYGWESPADGRLEIGPDGVLMHYPGVGPLHFDRLPAAEGDAGAELEAMDGALLTDHGNEYRVRTKEDRVYHFGKGDTTVNAAAQKEVALVRIADLCDNWLEFERRAGRLVAINESAGRRIDIAGEDGFIGELALLVPDTGERHVFVRFEQDAQGDLAAVRDALGQPYTFAYDAHRMVRHTDRNGLSFYYEYDRQAPGEPRVVHAWGDGGLYNYRFGYNDVLGERRITDSLGYVTLVKLDQHGLPISELDPLGGVTIFEYDAAGRTIGLTDQCGNRTGYEYDERGNLLRLTRPDGTCIQIGFDRADKPVLIVDSSGASWRQKWDARGLLVERATPLGNLSRYEYDDRGQLVAFSNPRGARTGFTFDHVGNLTSTKDALGNRTLLAYDMLGNVARMLDPLDRKTGYRYDAKSRLVEMLLPSGAAIRCAYDVEDNLVRYTDENGGMTHLEYCGHGELARRVQPDGARVDYQYDTEERLIRVVNQRRESFQFRRDVLGRIVEQIDYWGQSRSYHYSACGQLERSVDALGQAIDYATDAFGRILRRTLPDPDGGNAPFEEQFEYDANGNLVACANPHIRVERSVDAEGRLLAEKQGDGFVIRNRYDAAGNRVERRTELRRGTATIAHCVKYAYDALDQLVSLEIDDEAPVRFEYDAAGQLVAQQLARGLRREMGYSGDGYLTRQTVRTEAGSVVDVAYDYDAGGNLTARRDAEFGVDQYIYDPARRIVEHLDPHRRVRQYLHDRAGDRLATSIPEAGAPGGADRSGLPSGADWMREGTQAGTTYRFDRAGNLIERRGARATLVLRWDAGQRLAESRLDGKPTHYRCDPLGRRIDKRTGSETTTFAWDGDALCTDAPVALAREFVYAPQMFEPIAMLQAGDGGAPRCLWYINDPNGCPVRMVDSAGLTMWSAGYGTYGEVRQTHVDQVDNPLRFQGQYADPETGLVYNRYRYFAPDAGIFISPDPLGLSAGDNPYAAAPNGCDWIDPLGLACSGGKNFKDHFIRHKKLLEDLLNKKYSPWKHGGGAEFLKDIDHLIASGRLQHAGEGTLGKGQAAAHIFRGDGLTAVIKPGGEFVTLLESGQGMDKAIRMLPGQLNLPGMLTP